MKKILRWLFAPEMRKLEDEAFQEYMRRNRSEWRNFVAERFLKDLGYEIVYDSGVRMEGEPATHAAHMGYRLVKKDPTPKETT